MPEKTIRTVRTRKGVREYTHLGCPMTRNRTAWCFRLCVPDVEGKGECGRLAPHGLRSRTQLAIEEHNRQLKKARIAELETAYLVRPEPGDLDPGVRIAGGEAEIVLHLDGDRSPDATALPQLCFRAMHDSARLAVASVVDDGRVLTAEFTVKLTGTPSGPLLVGRSLFVGMDDDRYLTESVLSDGESREIGRATGVFATEG